LDFVGFSLMQRSLNAFVSTRTS